MQKAKKTPLSARRLGAFPAPKSVIRTTERQHETTKAVEAPRSKHISWLSWLSTEMNDHDLKSQDFPKVRVPWVFSTFHAFQWLDVGSPAVPSGLLVVLYLLVKAPLPKITGHGSHYISLAAGPPFGDTDT